LEENTISQDAKLEIFIVCLYLHVERAKKLWCDDILTSQWVLELQQELNMQMFICWCPNFRQIIQILIYTHHQELIQSVAAGHCYPWWRWSKTSWAILKVVMLWLHSWLCTFKVFLRSFLCNLIDMGFCFYLGANSDAELLSTVLTVLLNNE
jgi:hypothetical protein